MYSNSITRNPHHCSQNTSRRNQSTCSHLRLFCEGTDAQSEVNTSFPVLGPWTAKVGGRPVATTVVKIMVWGEFVGGADIDILMLHETSRHPTLQSLFWKAHSFAVYYHLHLWLMKGPRKLKGTPSWFMLGDEGFCSKKDHHLNRTFENRIKPNNKKDEMRKSKKKYVSKVKTKEELDKWQKKTNFCLPHHPLQLRTHGHFMQIYWPHFLNNIQYLFSVLSSLKRGLQFFCN